MPFRNLSLEEFARHVGMDLRDVEKLATRGKLPGEKIGGHWRFNRAKVTEWLQQEMPTLPDERLVQLERAMAPPSPEESKPDVVTGMMSLAGIDMNVRANSRTSILRELVNLSERTGLLYDKDGLLAAVMEREEMCTTGLPNGVAVPHPRQPMPYASAEPFVCLARAPQGIPFGAPNGALSHLFFLICSHDDRQHLYTLARLVRLLDRDTVTALGEADEAEAALNLLIEREEFIASRGL